MKTMRISSMRKTLIFLACLLPLAAAAQTSIQFNLSVGNQNIAPFTNVEVILQQVGINQSATMTYLGEPIVQYTDTNAQTTFANLQTAAGGATSYWQWTVPDNSTPNGPVNSYSGYVQVTSTNLGTISSSLVQVFAVPTPTGLGWAYSAQTSDLRYSPTSAVLTNYALLGNLTTASNALYGQIVGATNGQTSIIFSNPAAYSTPYQVTNIVLSLAQTSAPTSLVTITNIANAAANSVGLNGTNYATAATNTATVNLTAAIAGTNAAVVAALNATNTLLLADIVAATNSLKGIYQPPSGVLTNLAATGALTNGLAAGQNVSLTTNGSGTFISINATNQTWLTNGLGPWVGLLPSSYLPTNALPGLTNGFVTQTITNGLATLQAATNAAGGIYTNNPSGYITLAATNAMATTNYVQTYADTNGAAAAAVATLTYQRGSGFLTNLMGTGAVTNGFVPGANFSMATNGSGTLVTLNATNQTWLTNGMLNAYAPTNTLNGWYDTNGAGLAAALAATNGFLPIATNIAKQFAFANGSTNQFSPGTNTTFTTNVSGTIISIGSVWQTWLTNGMLTGYATTNVMDPWFDTNGAYLWAYTNSIQVSTNFAATNTTAAVATALNFAATNTALPFVPTNAGTVNALTVTTSLQFGADTNFILGTNWITVKGAGTGLANGVYSQIFPGVYTNNTVSGWSIVNSGGIYSLLNTNGQTCYLTNAVNGFWLVGPYGSAPRPYVAFSPTFDPILLGNIYATNLIAQAQAVFLAYLATNSPGGGGTNGTTNFLLSGVVSSWTTNNLFSALGTNVITGLIAQYGTNPTNGISALAASNIVLNYGSTLYDAINAALNATNGLAAWVKGYTNGAAQFTTLGLLTNYVANNGGSGATYTNVSSANAGVIIGHGIGTNFPVLNANQATNDPNGNPLASLLAVTNAAFGALSGAISNYYGLGTNVTANGSAATNLSYNLITNSVDVVGNYSVEEYEYSLLPLTNTILISGAGVSTANGTYAWSTFYGTYKNVTPGNDSEIVLNSGMWHLVSNGFDNYTNPAATFPNGWVTDTTPGPYGTNPPPSGIYLPWYGYALGPQAYQIFYPLGSQAQTYAGNTAALNANGIVNAQQFQLNGIPIQTIISSSQYPFLWVTNCSGPATNFQGEMFNTAQGFYTNANGACLIPPGYVGTSINGTNFTTPYALLCSNLASVLQGYQFYSNPSNVLGYYNVYPGIGNHFATNQPLVSLFNVGVLFGNAAALTNNTPMASLGPYSLPGSNAVAAMIVALGTGGGGTNSPTFVQTTNIAAAAVLAGTNGLGTAAFTQASAYDAAGTAMIATNNLANGAFTLNPLTNGMTVSGPFQMTAKVGAVTNMFTWNRLGAFYGWQTIQSTNNGVVLGPDGSVYSSNFIGNAAGLTNLTLVYSNMTQTATTAVSVVNNVIVDDDRQLVAANSGSATNLALLPIPTGAANGWVFTLTNTTTGQGTWSNNPAGGSTNSPTFIQTTNIANAAVLAGTNGITGNAYIPIGLDVTNGYMTNLPAGVYTTGASLLAIGTNGLGGGTGGGSANYSAVLSGTNVLVNSNGGITNSFFWQMTNNSIIDFTNFSVSAGAQLAKATIVILCTNNPPFTLTTTTNCVFGVDVTGWTVQSNLTYIAVIGPFPGGVAGSSNVVHAVSQVRGYPW